MRAIDLLRAVAKTYEGLETLTADMMWLSESGDEDSINRSEQRVKALFATPDKVRFEQGGRTGMTIVADGKELHHYFGAPKRYSKTAAPQSLEMLPGYFRPEFPIGGPTFLFHRISERISRAELNGLQANCHVVLVSYEPPSHPSFNFSTSPVKFWVDRDRNLILRLEGEVSHRHPAHDDMRTIKHTLVVNRIVINQAVSPESFEYVPPQDAVEMSSPGGRGMVAGGGGGGAGSYSGPGGRGFERWTSHEWAGPDTVIETTKLKFEGHRLSFERRLSLAEDRKSLEVGERVNGPGGTAEYWLSVPLS